MKLSVFNPALAQMSLEEACKYLHDSGVQAIEIGCGGFPGDAHCKPRDLLAHPEKIDEMLAILNKYELEIAAFSVHGNAVHPNKEIAAKFHDDFEQTVLLAEKMGVTRIITFSGCPGGSPEDKTPNWVTCPWPDDFSEILEYQWNEVLIPYWKEMVAFANEHHVTKIALELHPGFCCYNTESLLKLREAVGPTIGANFDPSHLVWQGMEPAAAIRMLGDAIFHVHAKDTKIDKINTAKIGVLDTKHYGDELNRAWVFRALGYGHDVSWWKDIVDNLRLVGYDGVLSIEHEDSLMSIDEGLSKALDVLKEAIMHDPKPSTMAWA